MLSAIACGTDELVLVAAGIFVLIPGGCGNEAMLIDLLTSLFSGSRSRGVVVVDIDRKVGMAGLDFAETVLGDMAGLRDREGVRKTSLEGT